MAWVWSDELAAALETAGAPDDAVAALRRTLVGLAVPEDEDRLVAAAALLGIEFRSGAEFEARDGDPSRVAPSPIISSL